jgi:AcrR family transcriptional regulator
MPSRDSAQPDETQENGQTPAREARALTPQTPRGEATRQRILDAAEEVFGDLGYYEASISEITRRAKVAQGTFYIYFHSKREIFVELVEHLGNRLRAATNAASHGAISRLAAERQGFAAFFDFVAQHRRVYQIVQEAERVAPEAARTYYQRISDGYQRRLREAVAAGEIRAIDAEVTTYALMGIAHFEALRWILWEDSEHATVSPAVLDAIFAFIAHGLERPR